MHRVRSSPPFQRGAGGIQRRCEPGRKVTEPGHSHTRSQNMEPYDRRLKAPSRALRKGMTDAEQALWARVRRKQIRGVQFYRQKPILSFIVDFYCPAARLVVELDGSQHHEPEHAARDRERDAQLGALGLAVLRFEMHRLVDHRQGVVFPFMGAENIHFSHIAI